jgi:hypothetical protein
MGHRVHGFLLVSFVPRGPSTGPSEGKGEGTHLLGLLVIAGPGHRGPSVDSGEAGMGCRPPAVCDCRRLSRGTSGSPWTSSPSRPSSRPTDARSVPPTWRAHQRLDQPARHRSGHLHQRPALSTLQPPSLGVPRHLGRGQRRFSPRSPWRSWATSPSDPYATQPRTHSPRPPDTRREREGSTPAVGARGPVLDRTTRADRSKQHARSLRSLVFLAA